MIKADRSYPKGKTDKMLRILPRENQGPNGIIPLKDIALATRDG